MIRKCIILICATSLILLTTVSFAYAASNTTIYNGNSTDLWALEQDAIKQAQKGYQIADEENNSIWYLFENSYKKANSKQKELLDNIQYNNSFGSGIYQKQIMQIMGELSEDIQYITKEQISDICSQLDPNDYTGQEDFIYDVMHRFDEITGAPDFIGGTGSLRAIYYTNEAHTEYVLVTNVALRYYDTLSGAFEKMYSLCD